MTVALLARGGTATSPNAVEVSRLTPPRTAVFIWLILLLSQPSVFAQDIQEILYLDRTYVSGPLTIERELSTLLLIRFRAKSDGALAGPRITNVPKARVRYLLYDDHAVPFFDAHPTGQTSLRRRMIRPQGGLLSK